MKDIAALLKHQSPPQQLPSHGNGWIELPNGKRWNPGYAYKFRAEDSIALSSGTVIRFLPSPARRFLKFLGGVHAF
ncbi:hypothetical protein AWI07_03825 [Enterobacter roggenkampii]|uniref:phage filamentation protein Fil family protein n=1 Tax=Enterobacter roggenkampii TaxID=1812935 RepID=UPI0007511E04|nr:phage filamentation protein Fil family protein [Enterobacter roggenkampii]KUQ05659.1 hypothetical protein AWI07_03825 [Enterobacter roggenkampii]